MRFGFTCGGGGYDNDGPGGVRYDHRRAAGAAARRAGTAVAIGMVVVNAHRVFRVPRTRVRCVSITFNSSSPPNRRGPSGAIEK